MNQCVNHVTTELSKYPPADKAALRPFVAWFWLLPQNLFLFVSEPFALTFFSLRLEGGKQPAKVPKKGLEIVNVISRIANKIYHSLILFKSV